MIKAMIKVMIIDDEENTRERLKSIIDWKGLSASLVCEAKDSDTAMELYILHRPKIVITDINIPVKSGLELAIDLQEIDPEIRFIVITGYNDLDLIKPAFELQTVNILRKPIQAEEINGNILKAIRQIEEARESINSFSKLQQVLMENLPQIRKSYIEEILRHPPKDPAMVAERLSQLNIRCDGANHVVVLIRLIPDRNMENGDAILFLLRDLFAAEMEASGFSVFPVIDSHRRLICIVSSDLADFDDIVEDTLIRIQERFEGNRIFAGIGQSTGDLACLHESFAGALTALNYQCVLGDESITHYKNMEQTGVIFHSKEPVYEYLLKLFRAGNIAEIRQAIQKQTSVIMFSSSDSNKIIRNFFLEYVVSIVNEAIRLGLEVDRPDQMIKIFTDLFHSTDTEECMEEIVKLTSNLINQIQVRREATVNQLISQAKEYIRSNLHNERLDLYQVSYEIGLSRVYFCKLFHQIVGVSFINYLKYERIDLAKKMLLDTNMKVYEISDAVGFSNPKYFSYVFKQVVGQTPIEYQESIQS